MIKKFSSEFSEQIFWKKLKKFAFVAGKEVVSLVLQLYYTIQLPSTSAWAKTVIIGSLVYFISPIDALPDMVPILGYSDDLGVLIGAITTVSTYITDEIKAKSEETVSKWFDSH